MGDRQGDDLRLIPSDAMVIKLRFLLCSLTDLPMSRFLLSFLRIRPQIGMDTFLPGGNEKNQRCVGADVLCSTEVHSTDKIARLPPAENWEPGRCLCAYA